MSTTITYCKDGSVIIDEELTIVDLMAMEDYIDPAIEAYVEKLRSEMPNPKTVMTSTPCGTNWFYDTYIKDQPGEEK